MGVNSYKMTPRVMLRILTEKGALARWVRIPCGFQANLDALRELEREGKIDMREPEGSSVLVMMRRQAGQ